MPTLTHPTQAALALPYGPIAVGWPVIANETEGPCTQLMNYHHQAAERL